MKFVKRISYFFVIPVVFLILGIFLGVWGIHFFYPGQWQDLNENRLALPLTEEETAADTDPYEVAPRCGGGSLRGDTLCGYRICVGRGRYCTGYHSGDLMEDPT